MININIGGFKRVSLPTALDLEMDNLELESLLQIFGL